MGQGFANINQYLAANPSGGQSNATNISNTLAPQSAGLKSTVDTAIQGGQQAVAGGIPQFDPNIINQAVQNPSQFVKSPENVNKISGMRDATYKGPGSFQDTPFYGSAIGAVNKGQETAQLGKTGSGYQQLLSQIAPGESAGNTSLDTALIQSNPQAVQTIQGALQPFSSLQNYLQGASGDINSQIANAKSQTANVGTQTKTALQQGEKAQEKKLAAKVIPEKAQQQYGWNLDLNTPPGSVSQEDWRSMLHNAATPEDRENFNAINQLLQTQPYLWI